MERRGEAEARLKKIYRYGAENAKKHKIVEGKIMPTEEAEADEDADF